MMRIPGTPGTPPPPPGVPPIGPKKGEGKTEGKVEGKAGEMKGSTGRAVYELDATAIAARMAALAEEIRERNIPMDKIIEEAIARTGITNPEAAMEEANKVLQKEIEEVLDQIKQNKEMMEEAAAWQSLGELLEQHLTEEQIRDFLNMMEVQIKGWNG